MTKIDIFSGFLGAGKTTLIKKLIAEAYAGEKIVLIENEFGEIAIDGGFLQDAGVTINEMNSGCICCSLVGDFEQALKQVLEQFSPDRILIEPSGVGKLSDVIRAVQSVESDDLKLNGFTTVVDANKCRIYMKNFGEFFNNQVEHASAIILSRTDGLSQEKLDRCVAMLREKNATATIVTTPWDQITGAQILETMERQDTLAAELEHLEHEAHEHHHHHDEDEECGCGHHHHHDDDDEDEHEHHHHHHHDHDDDDHECCHHHDHDDDEEHHHHHDHEHGEECGCGHHHDHHHHHADEVFTSWGAETPRKYTDDEIRAILDAMLDEQKYGVILRSKGIVPATDGGWIHFDYVPGESDVRRGGAQVTGRICVIGSKLNEDALKELFCLG
ncbi:MAG: GTP-binding protein [Oscillospiraceae bacterium]|nr:GTP-binding protein [Oscillospiraceae bacterium]